MAMLVLPLAMAIMAILAILAIYGLYGHGRWQYQHGHYGYPVEGHRKTYSNVLFLSPKNLPVKSYDRLNILSQNLHCKNGTFHPQLFHMVSSART